MVHEHLNRMNFSFSKHLPWYGWPGACPRQCRARYWGILWMRYQSVMAYTHWLSYFAGSLEMLISLTACLWTAWWSIMRWGDKFHRQSGGWIQKLSITLWWLEAGRKFSGLGKYRKALLRKGDKMNPESKADLLWEEFSMGYEISVCSGI